jgi:hypothetical protein
MVGIQVMMVMNQATFECDRGWLKFSCDDDQSLEVGSWSIRLRRSWLSSQATRFGCVYSLRGALLFCALLYLFSRQFSSTKQSSTSSCHGTPLSISYFLRAIFEFCIEFSTLVIKLTTCSCLAPFHWPIPRRICSIRQQRKWSCSKSKSRGSFKSLRTKSNPYRSHRSRRVGW